MTNKVFVYGTLMKGNKTRGLDQFPGSEFVGGALTADSKYSLYDLGAFPAASLQGNNRIKGEVWEVSEETFLVLDRIEGYPDFYNRKLVNTTAGTAWMYYIPDIHKDAYATMIQSEDTVSW